MSGLWTRFAARLHPAMLSWRTIVAVFVALVALLCAGAGNPTIAANERIDLGMEDNKDYPGPHYRSFHIDGPWPDRCQRECLSEKDRCKAWTYVRPGFKHEKYAVCFLKESVYAPQLDNCCISGQIAPPGQLTPVGPVPPPAAQPPADPTPAPAAPPPPNTGASYPYGAIGDKYAGLGGAGGPLGAPTGGESDAPHGGRCHQFQRGMICWHPQIGEAFGVWGMIYSKWAQVGRTEFGYPITDERVTSDGRGRFNHFRGMQYPNRPEASIFWSPQTGAHAIYGAIRDAWAQQGWERGPFGYPTSDEFQDGKARRQNFERGVIKWAPDTGIETWKNF